MVGSEISGIISQAYGIDQKFDSLEKAIKDSGKISTTGQSTVEKVSSSLFKGTGVVGKSIFGTFVKITIVVFIMLSFAVSLLLFSSVIALNWFFMGIALIAAGVFLASLAPFEIVNTLSKILLFAGFVALGFGAFDVQPWNIPNMFMSLFDPFAGDFFSASGTSVVSVEDQRFYALILVVLGFLIVPVAHLLVAWSNRAAFIIRRRKFFEL